MRRRLVLIGLTSIFLSGCIFAETRKRIGPHHWIRRTDGYTMLVWGKDGAGICGVNFLNSDGEDIRLFEPETLGISGDWILIGKAEHFWAVSQDEKGHTAKGPYTEIEMTKFLTKHNLTTPKMRAL